MVGHQDIRMKLTVLALQGLAQLAKVGVAILVIEEAGPAVVATLFDVQRDTVDVNAWTPGHGRSPAEIEPGPFYLLHKKAQFVAIGGIECLFVPVATKMICYL
jgi:hypothetical protein